MAYALADENGQIRHFALPGGLGPADFASAYQLSSGLKPQGTIALVEAYGYSQLESDLAVYRATFALPPCGTDGGCLRIVNQRGQDSPLPPEPPFYDDWTLETALDVQIASAVCPSCSLLVVQADDNVDAGLFVAQATAVALGATVISNSWGAPNPGTQAPPEEAWFALAVDAGVGEFASSGDCGADTFDVDAGTQYPSTSAYVVSVGGTTLMPSSTTARGWGESAWFGSGSSCSASIARPAWQVDSGCAGRAAADVSAVADPNTGAAVYNNGPSSSGWTVIGGTSLATPLVAGIFVLTGHADAGPSFSYANPNDFFDVTFGFNGPCPGPLCHAGPGWDGPTGNGTPNGPALGGCLSCVGRDCGGDGCGGSCGGCGDGEMCSAGKCVCAPQCAGKQCGSNGCGGFCGTCKGGRVCTSQGTCAFPAVPDAGPAAPDAGTDASSPRGCGCAQGTELALWLLALLPLARWRCPGPARGPVGRRRCREGSLSSTGCGSSGSPPASSWR